MAQRQAAPATAAQVAQYGHIAALLRAELDRRKWTAGDLNKALGKPPGYSAAYQWLNAKGAPSPQFAKKMGKALDIPWQKLLRNADGAPPPGTDLVRVAERAQGQMAPVRAAEVLHFSVLSDGTTRLRMDMVASVDRGVALLRLLLDAGMVVAHTNSQGA